MLSLAERKRKTVLQGELRGLRKKERAERDVGHKRAEPEAPGQRQPRVRDIVYLQWIRRLPCVYCRVQTGFITTPSQAAHVRCGYPADGWRPTGMSEKPDDRRTVPLCAIHHTDGPRAQHRSGERAWWNALRIHPPALCAALNAAFDAGKDGAEVIHQLARSIPQ